MSFNTPLKKQIQDAASEIRDFFSGDAPLEDPREVFSSAVNLANFLGKPCNNDPSQHDKFLQNKLEKLFFDILDDKTRVAPEGDQFRLVFRGDTDFNSAVSIANDSQYPLPNNHFPIHSNPRNRQNNNYRGNRRRRPTKRSQNFGQFQRQPDHVPPKPKALNRGIDFDVAGQNRLDHMPVPSLSCLPPPVFLPPNASNSILGAPPHFPVQNLHPSQCPRFPFEDQNPALLSESQKVQYITALQRECRKLHELLRL